MQSKINLATKDISTCPEFPPNYQENKSTFGGNPPHFHTHRQPLHRPRTETELKRPRMTHRPENCSPACPPLPGCRPPPALVFAGDSVFDFSPQFHTSAADVFFCGGNVLSDCISSGVRGCVGILRADFGFLIQCGSLAAIATADIGKVDAAIERTRARRKSISNSRGRLRHGWSEQ